MKSLFVSLVLLVFSVVVVSGQHVKSVTHITRESVTGLINKLLVDIEPGRPENSYFPPFMAEKIRWVYAESNARFSQTGKRMIFPVFDAKNVNGNSLMGSSYYTDGLPYITVMAEPLVQLFGGKIPLYYTREQKNSFAITLVHETVHLELPKALFPPLGDKERLQQEEFRAYAKVDKLVVGPLLAKKEPMAVFLIELNHILNKCGHKLPCKAFFDKFQW